MRIRSARIFFGAVAWALMVSVTAAAAPRAQEHATRPADASAMTLEQLEVAALEANPEIRALAGGVNATQARVPAAGALDDPSFMYRGWGVPLREPWNFNQAQNMFAVTQALPGPGKRALRSRIAQQDVSIAKAMLEGKKREITARVRAVFYALLRNSEELRLHGEQVALARQGMEAARIKYTVGRVPQQDVLKAQIAVTKLVDHLLMFQQEGQLARAELNTLLGRNPVAPLEVTGGHAAPADLPQMAELERIALENRPELLATSLAVQRSETKTRLAGKGYTPDYTVTAGYMLQPTGSPFRTPTWRRSL